MTSTAERLRQRNRKTIWLKEKRDAQGNTVVVRADEGEGLPFVISRVRGTQIGQEAMQALLSEDEYVRFANWYARQGSEALDQARARTAKVGDAKPFDDALPPSEDYNAHMLALSKVMQRAVLREGMADPTYAETAGTLGLYEGPLHEAIRTFGRELVSSEPDSSSGNSVPP